MNKKEALQILSSNLEKYSAEGFGFHKRFLQEFEELLVKASGHEKEIFALLVKQLNFIKQMGHDVYKADSNEVLKYLNGEIISLHLESKNFNFRLLITFREDTPVFLCAFYERSDKKKTDYTQWREVIEQRLREV